MARHGRVETTKSWVAVALTYISPVRLVVITCYKVESIFSRALEIVQVFDVSGSGILVDLEGCDRLCVNRLVCTRTPCVIHEIKGLFMGQSVCLHFRPVEEEAPATTFGLSKEHAASVIGPHDQTLNFHDIVRELTGCLNFSVCCSVSTIEDGYLPSFPSHCVGEETIAEHVHAHGLHENIYIVLWSE